jgi:hypothetical protein
MWWQVAAKARAVPLWMHCHTKSNGSAGIRSMSKQNLPIYSWSRNIYVNKQIGEDDIVELSIQP